jgi:hypothetical protein
MIQDRELLRPSLTGERGAPAAIYSVRTGFLAAFFGGPIGGTLIALLNSQRLRRLSADAPLLLLALGVTLALRWWLILHAREWLDSLLGKGSVSYFVQLLGLAFFGVAYMLHRAYYRSMSLLGLQIPNGLRVGVAAIVLGIAAETALFAALFK